MSHRPYDKLLTFSHTCKTEASSRYSAPASARPMPSSNQVTATIPGYFGCTNCASKMVGYGRGDLV